MSAQNQEFSREQLEGLLKRRFFYAPSFDIYGGVSGLYDYGPPGCALQANLVEAWRKHFVLEEDMLEVDCTALTPHEVLKTSGHVDKFSDWMCRDTVTGEIFRADHLVEEVLEARLKGDLEARGISEEPKEESEKDKKRKKKVKEIKAVKLDEKTREEYETILAKIDGFSGPELGDIMVDHKIVNPVTGGKLESPMEFNLMFETAVGPSGVLKGYLRPETAQGQFLNFNKLLESNNLKMPFASASIGKSFRNEISPRAGLLRVREFLMAEIEHYVDPEDKSHPRFKEVSGIKLKFLSKGAQEAGKTDLLETTIGEAVSSGMVDNETLGYFLGRIYLFMMKIGMNPDRVRFRQHMSNEMAHYASDCWDCELHSSYGWIECVGCADRSAYDLSVHSARTKENLVVRQPLEQPITVEAYEVDLNKKKFGPKFRKDAPKVEGWILSRTDCEREDLAKELEQNGKIVCSIEGMGEVEIDKDLVVIEKRKRVEHVREYVPNVIEPSFGIGRIFYSLIEQVYWVRPEDAARGVLSFPPLVAPTKVLVVPLSANEQLSPIGADISKKLRRMGIPSKVDDSSASIGKRYSRNDELGTPYGITIDFQTVKDGSVTIRERDTTKQKRGSQEEVLKAIQDMVVNGTSWDEGTKHLAVFESQEE
ncbi:glycine--tRNA ligase 1, mitochondrial [Trichomonascus vanleenenianus]|uniref:glycine--tRNA ligase n=1 Tax=Trichomonascus vanleenenianus TaxID=2268995 RepID=UPI003ECB634A